jgi:hypothetical protein
MSRTTLIIIGAALLAACGGSSTIVKTQAQLAADLCTALAASCTGTDDQLESDSSKTVSQNQTVCEDKVMTTYDLPVSDPNGKNNDLDCRVAEARKAATDPAHASAHCLNAGPTGGGKGNDGTGACGNLCDVYCDLQELNCTNANPSFGAGLTRTFLSRSDCETKCAATITPTHFSSGGTVNAQTGDSLQCRIWHLGKARSNPSPHCANAKLDSGDPTTATGTQGPCTGPVR